MFKQDDVSNTILLHIIIERNAKSYKYNLSVRHGNLDENVNEGRKET